MDIDEVESWKEREEEVVVREDILVTLGEGGVGG